MLNEIIEQCNELLEDKSYFLQTIELTKDEIKVLLEEITRLNNIINELEDTIYGKYHYFEDKLFKDAGERLLEKTYKGILDEIKRKRSEKE